MKRLSMVLRAVRLLMRVAPLQNLIDAKLDRRRKGVFGPPVGKRAIIFVDDLNMPTLEAYGAQPPIELLRQFMDHGGWYDRQNTFRKMDDCQFIAAMGPPGGGRNHITSRYARHFSLISITDFDDSTLRRIFSTILTWALNKTDFPMNIKVSDVLSLGASSKCTDFPTCKLVDSIDLESSVYVMHM